MICPQCEFDNPGSMKFCGECGARLEARCPSCQAEVPPGFKFCGECGAQLGEAAPGPAPADSPPAPAPSPPAGSEGEIKQATVLHLELLVTPDDRLDPEERHTLLNRFSSLARQEVEGYEGAVNQFLGQGLVALFGAPVALEDHPHRAVLAATVIRDRLAALSAELENDLGVRSELRAGIDTGEIVIGGVGDLTVGDTAILAAALARRAGAGELLVGPGAARHLAGNVELVAAGKEDGHEVHGVRGVVAERTGRSFLRTRLAPMVGRSRELAVLRDLKQKAEAGQGQVVGVAGEPGSGKSRLLYEFFRSCRHEGVTYLRGGCVSYGAAVPYFPLLDMVRKASYIDDRDSPTTVAAKLRASLQAVGVEADPTLPFLLRLLNVREGSEALDELEPLALQEHIFSSLRSMVLNASRRVLVVIEVEDLHWLDTTSEAFLTSLIEAVPAARVLLLLSYRSGYSPGWLGRSYATQVTIQRLNQEDSLALMRSIVERTDVDEELAAGVLAKAEGNPFFLEELARSLLEHGRASADAVPDTVQGAVMARIDRLSEEHKRLLQTASVLGREFSSDLLKRLWDRAGALVSLLDDLQRWEFLYRVSEGGAAQYAFRHALTQDVAYASMLKSRRRELHGKAASALEETHAESLEKVYDRLIYHYPKANLPEKAVHYLSLFAAQAAESYAHAEAARALEEALGHAERLPEPDRRLIEVLLQLAKSLLPLARFPETLELFERYRDHVARVDDARLRAQYHFWLAHTHSYLGHQELAREHAERSIAGATECGDEAIEGKARYVLGRDCFWSGQFAEGIEHSMRAVVLLERSDEPWWQGQAYWVTGYHHYALGQFDAALEALERALSIGKALDDYRLDTSWSIGYVHASLGDAEAGLEHCRRGVEGAHDPLNTHVATGFLGFAYLEKGDIAAAVEALEGAVAELEESGMQQILAWFLVFLAEARRKQGAFETAAELVERALETARKARFDYGAALALRTGGWIELSQSRLEAAEQRLQEAASQFQRLEMPFEVARTQLAHARLSMLAKRRDQASEEIAEARATFDRLGLAAFVTLADDLDRELLGAPAP